MNELAKKLPVIWAITALAFLADRMITAKVDGPALVAIATAIAGLGGFYLRDLITRREEP